MYEYMQASFIRINSIFSIRARATLGLSMTRGCAWHTGLADVHSSEVIRIYLCTEKNPLTHGTGMLRHTRPAYQCGGHSTAVHQENGIGGISLSFFLGPLTF